MMMIKINASEYASMGENLFGVMKKLEIPYIEGEIPHDPIFTRREANIPFYLSTGLLSQDSEGNLNYINKEAERIFGYGISQAIGMPSTSLVPDEVANDRTAEFQKVLDGEMVHVERTPRITKKGDTVMIGAYIFPYDFMGRICIAASVNLLNEVED